MPLESAGSNVLRESIGKSHCSAAELESKSSLFPNHSFHIDSDIEFVHVIRILECQVKYTSNLESALSVTVHRSYYCTNPDCNCNCLAPEGKQEQEKTNEEYFGELIILFNS